ncbi:MAG: hypothetical protein ACKVOW_12890 [Chitinophagaceae bacterium]
MSKKIGDFIRKHRSEFDTDEPSVALWSKIAEQLNGTNKGRVLFSSWFRWGIAAAVLIIVGGAIFYWKKSISVIPAELMKIENESSTIKDTALLNEINPAYAKELYHFAQLIELKQQELKDIEKENPVLYSKFITDINGLDSTYMALKQALPSNPNREQLMQAMIRNLQVQMELLTEQLSIIQKIKQSKNNKSSI